MSIHITAEDRAAFEALISGDYSNFALFSCFVDGVPATAIVAVNREGEDYTTTPLFVSVTPDMVLTDHEEYPRTPGARRDAPHNSARSRNAQ